MKKSIQTCALVLALVLACCACSKKPMNDGEPLDTTVNTTGKEKNKNQSKLDVLKPEAYGNVEGLNLEPGVTISVLGKYTGDSFWDEVKAGAQRAVDDINTMLGYKGNKKIKLSYSAPNTLNDVDKQVSILDEELDRYPLAIGIAPVDASACFVQFDLAGENGIPIVTFDSGSNYADIAAHVSTNNIAAGQTAAAELAALMEGQGELAIFVQDSHSMSAKEREQGFRDTIAAQFPNISVVNVYYMDNLTAAAEAIAAEKNAALAEGESPIEASTIDDEAIFRHLLETHPNLKGIYATNLDSTQFVAEMLEPFDREDLYFVGIDGGKEQQKLLEEGIVDGLIYQNPYGIGYATVVAAARSVLDLGNEAYVDSGFTWVTKANLKDAKVKKLLY